MRKKSRRIRKLWGLLLAAALSVGLLSGLAAGTESASATEPVYTMTISVIVNVEKGGDAAAPNQTLSFSFYDYNEDPDCLTKAGVTIVSNSVTINSYGENSGEIVLKGTSAAWNILNDGFSIQMDDGGAGWQIRDTEWSVTAPSIGFNNTVDFEIKDTYDEGTAVASVSSDSSVTASEPVLLASASESGMASAAVLLASAAGGNTSDIYLTCTYTGWNLTFDTNGGSAIDTKAAGDGTMIDLSAYTPTKDGYTFSGWYSDSALTNSIEKVTLNTNTTVYAGWTPNTYTLTLDTNGGSSIDPITAEKGTVIDLSAYTPTRDGYTFNGWYLDSALATGITTITIGEQNENTTVYAGWTANAATTANTDTSGTDTDSGSAAPKTGDGSAAAPWFILLMAGVLGIAAFRRKRKIN